MKSYAKLAAPLFLFSLAACNGTPANGWIPGSVYQIEQLSMATFKGSPFTQALAANYLALARAEKEEYDWNSQKTFASKGLIAAKGTAPPPETLEYWNVSDRAAAKDLGIARARLMTMLATDAPARVPQWAANAQTNFDCWIQEQEEGWQFDEIAACRTAFMTTMDLIAAPPKPVAAASPSVPPAQPAATKQTNFLMFFDFDQSALTSEASRIIANAVKAIAADKPAIIKIIGYTDTSGTPEYNMKLSLRRSQAVENELTRNGVAPSSIRVEGVGEGNLLTQTADGVREPQNRRATIDLLGR
ncbi:OmpA family protein [Magnetospirillum moscoviense]|uniref:OmpA-like domain-containing protein n=1 Tax=Magnetospirillum moscoviense TaxID=1437059 RepID=A0A178MS30_9PROT|nr:OmpA family protein [Magnetospirillum moscoviense]MBF0324505.1 OmpA family protein [Alphaproteobacteria bacterium]OAN51530.1 hypothetical protein A6A05_01320 [Magnetospirillum moscoviense]